MVDISSLNVIAWLLEWNSARSAARATSVLAGPILGCLGIGRTIYALALSMASLVGPPASLQAQMDACALMTIRLLVCRLFKVVNGLCALWSLVMVKPLTLFGVVALLH